MTRSILLFAIVVSTGCAHAASRHQAPTPAPPPAPMAQAKPPPAECTAGDRKAGLGTQAEHSASELVARGTGGDGYQREAGVWLPAAPVLVNEDFDFAIAMAMDGVGAGIAAAKRKANNEQRAAELGSLTLPPEVIEQLELLRSCGIHRWGLSWKGREPALLIITDRFDAGGKLLDSKTAAHPMEALTDPKVWLAP